MARFERGLHNRFEPGLKANHVGIILAPALNVTFSGLPSTSRGGGGGIMINQSMTIAKVYLLIYFSDYSCTADYIPSSECDSNRRRNGNFIL